MRLFEAEMLAKELMSRYVPDYQFGWMNEKTVNGRCYYRERTIRLSRPLTPLRTPEAVRQTIMHEIAHALTPGSGHGPVWKAQMRRFGLPDGRCSQDEVDKSSISNWRADCGTCGRVNYMVRKPRVAKACRICCNKYNSGDYSEDYRLTFRRI